MNKQDIIKLENKITEWNRAYYSDNESLVSDKVYDDTVKQILDWYKEHPDEENYGPTAKVGSSLPNSKFEKVKHNKRMLSLANSYSIDEVKEFLQRYNITEFVAEQKMDGLSLSLWYEYGNLVRAVTRGDGEVGEDVTLAAKEIVNIPKTLSFINRLPFVEVRGEVLIPKDTFKDINKQQIEKDLPTFATSRNLASGTLRQLDTSLVKERGLRFVAYYILNTTDHDMYSYIKDRTTSEGGDFLSGKYQSDMLELLKDYMTFDTPEYVVNESIEYSIEALSGNEVYDTDGVVFKNNHIDQWTEETAKTPKWAFAYKYPTEQVETKILDVTWQVGRTGRITPVAELEPVNISGTLVSRATLHNMSEIKRKDIKINDYVIVEKAAEIIPQVVCLVISKRGLDCYDIVPPTSCPDCGAKVDTIDSSLYCMGDNCGVKVIEKITYFADRANMNIQGLGRSTVEKLVNAGLLTDIASIYELKNHRSELINLDKLSEKSVDKLLSEIEDSRNRDFGVILGSLGIPRIGRTNGRRLGNTYHGWKKLLTEGAITGFKLAMNCGDSTYNAILDWFINDNKLNGLYAYTRDWIKSPTEDGMMKFASKEFARILSVGLGKYEYNELSDGKLHRLVFCFTGKVPISRNELEDSIVRNGGDFSSSVSKNCTHMIAGLKPTNHKIETATKYGIKIISYEEYLNLIK